MGYADSDREAQTDVTAFREGLQKLGWAEGRNISIETRWAPPENGGAENNSRRNSSHCSPTSFFRIPHPLRRRYCEKRALSPSFSRMFPIRSAAASSRACRGRAATSRVSPLSRARWAASGWSCSRRFRRMSTGSRSCSTRKRRHMRNIT